MYKVDLYAKVRRDCLIDNQSKRSVSRKYGINRRTVSKMLSHSEPPGYRRKSPHARSKLGDYEEFINEILLSDIQVHWKQRHTAQRIYDRLCNEHGFDGSYPTVSRYVAMHRKKHKEVFCPLYHPAGDAQVDFGEAFAFIDNQKIKVHFFVMDLPFSDGLFIKAYPRENTEAFLDGHISSFEYFGGVPNKILYDNSKIAVSRIMGDGERKTTQSFLSLQSHYLFKDKFARVGKGNDKGKVENLIGYVRRNFMVPLPKFKNFDELNAYFLSSTRQREDRTLRGHNQTIKERLIKDKAAQLSLPSSQYEACHIQAARVSSQSLVRYKCNDYSVPVAYGYRDVLVKGFVNEILITHGINIIARHSRCYGRGKLIFNPIHYLPLLERKTGAFHQAAPLKDWKLPSCFNRLHKCLEFSSGKKGTRDYVRVLRLLEAFTLKEVTAGIMQGLQIGVHTHEAVKHLILHAKDPSTIPLDMSKHSKLAGVNVQKTDAGKYDELINSRRAA